MSGAAGSATRRSHALDILRAALRAADPQRCVTQAVSVHDDSLHIAGSEYSIAETDQIVVIGAGKATPAMAAAVEQLLGDRISAGAINTKYGHTVPLDRIRTCESGHPLPDQSGIDGTDRMLDLVSQVSEHSLILCLFSGGGSALMPSPAHGISLEEKQATTQALLRSGAAINEINAIRKHLSRTKGGLLARLAFPARIVCLNLSDVIGDPLDAIASGPTVPDPTTFADCQTLIERYQLSCSLPATVLSRIRNGAAGNHPETPKADDECFRRASTHIVGNNELSLEAASRAAEGLGYNTLILSSRIAGEARQVAKVHAGIGQQIRATGQPVQRPACVISGGETTVTLRGEGRGGRNQEFALAAGLGLQGSEGITVLSAGTDGTDGPTDAAGAIADGTTIARGRKAGLNAVEFLDRNDSYSYFHRLGDLVITGPTGTNVMDLQLVLVP